jgi:hypothetical protein
MVTHRCLDGSDRDPLGTAAFGQKQMCKTGFERRKMNLIFENTNQVRWFTNMLDVFDAANIAPQNYDWFVSDIETNWTPMDFLPIDQWFSGDELASFLREHEVQFIWAVFSAVPKGFRSLPLFRPYAEGNPRYWNGTEPAPQLHGALFEIVCWDSSGTILINLPEQAARSFIARYPDTRPLTTART